MTDQKNIDIAKLGANSNYLTCELEQKVAGIDDNNRSLAKFDRNSKEIVFLGCIRCGAPKMIHRNDDFENCDNKPTKEFIELMVQYLRQTRGIEKFKLVEGLDDINKLGQSWDRKRLRSYLEKEKIL